MPKYPIRIVMACDKNFMEKMIEVERICGYHVLPASFRVISLGQELRYYVLMEKTERAEQKENE